MNETKDAKIQVSVRLSVKILWQFMMYHAYSGFQGLFAVIFTFAAGFGLVTGYAAGDMARRGLLVAALLMFTVLQPAWLWYRAFLQAKNPVVAKQVDMTFDKSGIEVAAGTEKLPLSWDMISRACLRPTMCVLYTDRIRGYIIPAEALGEKRQAFEDLLAETLGSRVKRGVFC